MHRNEYRAKPRGLADLLLAYALIEDGILLQQDGSLIAGWSYRGPDMMSAAAAEMDALSARLNHVLRLVNITFPKPGEYEFVVLIDSDAKGTLSIEVNQAPSP